MSKNIFQTVKENFQVPEFKDFVRPPNNISVSPIDTTRLRVCMILDGEKIFSHSDVNISDISWEKIHSTMDGRGSTVLLYNRNNSAYPASVMGFDENHGEIILNQIQGIKDKKVAFRVDATFDQCGFYQNFLEENFFKNGIPVTLNPAWRSHFMNNRSIENYNHIHYFIEAMKKKYNLG